MIITVAKTWYLYYHGRMVTTVISFLSIIKNETLFFFLFGGGGRLEKQIPQLAIVGNTLSCLSDFPYPKYYSVQLEGETHVTFSLKSIILA